MSAVFLDGGGMLARILLWWSCQGGVEQHWWKSLLQWIVIMESSLSMCCISWYHGRNSLFPIFRQSPGWLTVSLLPLHQVADHKGWGEGEYLEQAENMVISAITRLRSLQCVLSVLQGGGGWTLQQAPLQLGEQPPYQTSGWLLSPHSPLCSRARTGPTADGGSVPPPPPQGARRDRRPTNDEETKKVMFNVLVALWNVLVAYWNDLVAYWNDLVACWNVLVSFWNVLIASWNFGSNF